MKKANPLILMAIIILIIVAVWYLLPSQEKAIERIEVDTTDLAFICYEYGADWIEGDCLINGQPVPEEDLLYLAELIADCQRRTGQYLGEGQCEIDGESYFLDMLVMFDDEEYMAYIGELRAELKSSCLDQGGTWLGGNLLEEFDWQCEIDGEILRGGEWEWLDEMKINCEEYGGTWLGGEDWRCEIKGTVFPGNWQRYFDWEESCQAAGGIWLGGDIDGSYHSWECNIDGEIFADGSWQRIEEMKLSCEEYGGTWLGGSDFACEVFDGVYDKEQWVRASAADRMGEACLAAGGIWLADHKECEGLSVQWCADIEMELEEVRGLQFNPCASPCRHDDFDCDDEECVTVCDLYFY